MSDKPIPFSAPMVRALLAGTKTQTRHVLGDEGLADAYVMWPVYTPGRKTVGRWHSPDRAVPHAIGDRLWVKEAFRQAYAKTQLSDGFVFRADAAKALGMDEYSDRHKWTSPLFMPRAFSRLTLTVTDVRVQRLHDISDDDAIAEGIVWQNKPLKPEGYAHDYHAVWCAKPQAAYQGLWESINGDGSWQANPWVAAYTFTVARGNIDQVQP